MPYDHLANLTTDDTFYDDDTFDFSNTDDQDTAQRGYEQWVEIESFTLAISDIDEAIFDGIAQSWVNVELDAIAEPTDTTFGDDFIA